MSLPYTRNQTYIAGVTKVPATDMNDIQDWLLAILSPFTGTGAIVVADDFTNSIINGGVWVTNLVGTGAAAIFNDTGAIGSARLTTPAPGDVAALETSLLSNVGTHEFLVSMRLKASTLTATSVVYAGFGSAPNSEVASRCARFTAPGSGTNWFVEHNGGSADTGVAFDADWHTFVIRRLSAGTLEFWIDGVLTNSIASGQFLDGRFSISAFAVVGSATLVIDRAYCMVFGLTP